ncbi:MAG TPA: DHH family phosphoesterase [Candidatus Norongarragalinales archaeon]|jgi:nanoRNase/pAp phosphatase (c-di-AMP/oligoRNAs hydrolase)|nr:DHH family phosphoesterase [Candidatus Norongarragalinales archaeon]
MKLFSTLSETFHALKQLKGRTLITFHSLGDVDAVASAIALEQLIPNSEAASIDAIASDAKRALKATKFAMPIARPLFNYDNVVFVDVSTPALISERLDELKQVKGKIVVIDHHYHSDYLQASTRYVDEESASTCEIVFELLKMAQKKPGDRLATLLLAGVFRDSANFKSAKPSTFIAVSELMKLAKKQYSQILAIAEGEPDYGQKMAVLDAVKNARMLTSKNHMVVAWTNCRAFTIQVASALVQCGADVGIAINPLEGKASAVKRETLSKPNVGQLMERGARKYSGSGGGHQHVGGAQFRPAYARLFSEFIANEALLELE